MFLYLSLSTKKCAAQKETSIEPMDTKRELKPKRSFKGKLLRKSWACFRDVSMARNMMSAVTEKQRPMSEAMANASKAGWPSSSGLPFSVPPGTELDVAKETPAIRAATTEQELEVSFSHSELSFTRSLCFCLKISPAVLSSLLVLKTKCSGTRALMYCSTWQNQGINNMSVHICCIVVYVTSN